MRNITYYELNGKKKESAERFILKILLKGKIKKYSSNKSSFHDESVNIYLTHLLVNLIDSHYFQYSKRYIHTNDAELFNTVEKTEDNYTRFMLYKINADNLLISLGIFGHIEKKANKSLSCTSNEYSRYLGRAKAYYELAGVYNTKIYRRHTSVSDVMKKLSFSLEDYISLLSDISKEYFDFIKRFSNREFSRFCSDFRDYEKKYYSEKKIDEFLDIYSSWMKTKSASDLSRLKASLLEVKEYCDIDISRILNQISHPEPGVSITETLL